jgi:hypothetical protein
MPSPTFFPNCIQMHSILYTSLDITSSVFIYLITLLTVYIFFIHLVSVYLYSLYPPYHIFCQLLHLWKRAPSFTLPTPTSSYWNKTSYFCILWKHNQVIGLYSGRLLTRSSAITMDIDSRAPGHIGHLARICIDLEGEKVGTTSGTFLA